jgi:hypothetical protein
MQMTRSKVAVCKVTPDRVLEDVERSCNLAGLRQALSPGAATILKDNKMLPAKRRALEQDTLERAAPAESSAIVAETSQLGPTRLTIVSCAHGDVARSAQ